MKRLFITMAVLLIIVPVAFSQQIDPEWAFRWFWSTDKTDQGDAIVVDDSGNIYIAGHTDSTTSYTDFITVRLNQDGDTVWTRLWDSPMDGIDQPEYIGVDNSGNVYVTGDVGRSSLAWKMDAAVLKYNPNGDLEWSFQYNGPASLDDRVEGFGIDNDGNIFVVGYTQVLTGSPGREDYLVIKLEPSGDTAWVRTLPTGNQTFDRLYDIAFGADNFIYVTGGFNNGVNYDVRTIKYDQSGDTVWTRTYNGQNNGDDVPLGIGIDDMGYVYIGGYTYNVTKDLLLLKYDESGNFIWDASFDGDDADVDNPRDMIVDGDGNSYFIGETNAGDARDILAVKFDNSGSTAWDFQYDAGGNEAELIFNNKALIQVDNEGNVYFGGATYWVPAGATLTNTLTFKLDADGNVVWYNRYNGPGNDFDQIRAVALDNNNNFFVTGYSTGIYNNWDLFVLKFTGEVVSPGNISGAVTDAATANPIENVHVVAEGTAVEDYTDVDGVYTLADLDVGTYNVIFSHADYNDLTVPDVVVTANETTTLDVELTALETALEYFPGDANMGTGQWPPQVIGGDVTYMVGYFRGINVPCNLGDPGFFCSADANGDCQVIGSDVTKMVSYFRGLTQLSYCSDYEPAWLSPGDFPEEAPDGWPNCLPLPVPSRIIEFDSATK